MFWFFFQILGSFVLIYIYIYTYIFIIHTEYFWLDMAGLKERFYTLILQFVYITFCLLTEPQTILHIDWLHTEYFDRIHLILLWSFFWACSFCSFIDHLCIKFQLTWSISHPWSFFGSLYPAWSLFFNYS